MRVGSKFIGYPAASKQEASLSKKAVPLKKVILVYVLLLTVAFGSIAVFVGFH